MSERYLKMVFFQSERFRCWCNLFSGIFARVLRSASFHLKNECVCSYE